MKSLLLILMLALGFPVFGQNYELGNPQELKGKRKIIVITGSDIKSRARVIREIEKAKLPVKITDSASEAEVFLILRVGYLPGYLFQAQVETNGSNSTSIESDKEAGAGSVFIVSSKTKRLRQLIEFRDVQRMPLERRPATNFAREFIKAYKSANGLGNN